MKAPVPPNEDERLQALQRYAILDTPPEAAFERLARLAARIFDVPIAGVDLLDKDRQWFKACCGLDTRETPRDIAFCAHAVLSYEVMVVPDASQDTRFAENPLVTGETAIRFYACAPLHSPDGFNIGALAIMNHEPRQLSETEIATLTDLAALVVDEMELRLAAAALRTEADVERRQGASERRQAARELQRSEENFRSLIENASDIIAVMDSNGIMRYQSPSTERLLGYQPGELIGRNALELIHPEDVGVAEAALGRILQTPGVAQTVEYRFRHQDGSWRVFESVAKTLLGDSAADGVVVNARDITARRETENKYRSVVENAIEGIFQTSPEGRYLAANPALARMYGYDSAADMMADISNIAGQLYAQPGRRDEFVRLMNAHDQVTQFESPIRRKDGSVLWISENARALRDSEGRLIGYEGTVMDYTARHQAETALRQANDELEMRVEARTNELADVIEALRGQIAERQEAEDALSRKHHELSDFFENAAVGMHWMGADGKVLWVNKADLDLLGYKREEFIGRSITDFHVDQEVIGDILQRLSRNETIDSYEARLVCKDGTIKDVLISSNVLWEDGRFVHTRCFTRDNTARKRAEEKTRFQAHLLNTVGQAIIATDLQGEVTYWNRFAEVLYGWPSSEAVGRKIIDMNCPQVSKRQAAEIMVRLTAGESWSGEFIVQRGDGTTFPASTMTQPVLDTAGTLVGIIGISTDISERRQAEEALRESEKQFRVLTEAIPDQVWAARPDGALEYVNGRVLEHFERGFDEIINWGWTDFVHLDDLPQTLARWNLSLETGAVYETEFRVKRARDGAYCWHLARALPLRDEENRIVKWFGTNTDISERKQAEEALRESEALKTAIVETALDCIISMDHEGRVIEWNPAAEATFGYARAEAIGRLLAKLIIPDEFHQQHYQGIARYLTTGEGAILGRRVEVPALRADGKEILIELSITPLLSTRPPVFTAYARDITARKQTETALRESEERLRTIIGSIDEVVFEFDAEGIFIDVWTERSDLLVAPKTELIGRSVVEFLGEEVGRPFVATFAHVIASGQPESIEYALEILDGKRWFLARINPIFSTDGCCQSVCMSARDITTRKQDEEKLQAAKAEAERANLAKSDFLSRMSHELRTPMNAILGFAQLLEMDELNAEQRQGIEQILKGGRHLLGLINEVLDIACIEAEEPLLEMERVPVIEVLAGALEMVRPLAAPRNITLRSDWSAAEGLCVVADQRRLSQVLLNLLSNAVKYNRAGGSATLSVASAPAGRLSIAISDTGMGIAPQDVERLWMPFDRLGAERTGIEGTGLGLALTKRLVEAMGGFISVQSAPEGGSTFTVELPLAQPGHSSEQVQPADGQTEKTAFVPSGDTQALVLYIEDNLSNVSLVQDILRHRPKIKLLAATRGRQGLELAAKHCPDLILLDVHLPDINGDAVLRLLRADERTNTIPVIGLSADATPHQIEQLRAAGADVYLTKPLDVKLFLKVLEENLEAKI